MLLMDELQQLRRINGSAAELRAVGNLCKIQEVLYHHTVLAAGKAQAVLIPFRAGTQFPDRLVNDVLPSKERVLHQRSAGIIRGLPCYPCIHHATFEAHTAGNCFR